MPPGSSQKGTGKKGAGAMARQRSRNTTPSSVPTAPTASLPPVETIQTEHLDLPFDLFRNLTYEDLVDQPASNAVIPDSKSLDGIIARLTRLQETIEKRGSFCDRGMRLLASNRRTRMDELAAERSREEERLRREAADDEERERKANKANKKKRKATENLAPQDTNTERSSPLRESTSKGRTRDNDSVSSSLSPPAPATPSAMEVDKQPKAEENEDDSDSSSDDGAPPPPRIPQANTFGEDPSTFPDPTVYEIRPVKSGMSEEEIREIYSVATYPRSDLGDLIAGDPPDKDFSNAKPSNQISFSTFSTYIEPYFRPFTEEDLAFLRERGDRVTPFQMPRRGKKHYTDIWAEEDGAMSIDSSPNRDKLPPNIPRGTIENMDDDVAESDKLSVGPLLSRLLQTMRPESRAPAPSEEGKPLMNGTNGSDTPMNGSTADLSINGIDLFDTSTAPGTSNPAPAEPSIPPASFMPESTGEAWKKATHPKLDYMQVDERIKQELRHIGFLPFAAEPGQEVAPEAKPDYDGHYDDEVAARLRLLQGRLREQMLVNGARKARLTDLVKERMAHQEYQTILEDLDGQVNSAYLKRTRTMGKTKKKARPNAAAAAAHAAGGAGGGTGMARPGIGDVTRTLMERRRRWIENIGTVFDDPGLGKVPRSSDPDSSIFRPGEMAALVKREKETWEEEVEEE